MNQPCASRRASGSSRWRWNRISAEVTFCRADLRGGGVHPATVLTEETFAHLRDEQDHYIVSLPMEIATGEGIRIGVGGDHKHEEVGKSSSYLKRALSDRQVTHPASRDKFFAIHPRKRWERPLEWLRELEGRLLCA